MYTSLAVFGLAATAMAKAIPQGVTQTIAPKQPPPPGCSPSYAQSFQIQTINATTSTHTKRQQNNAGSLILSVQNGVLKNQQGNTGYIASNFQLQFDSPAQAGAIWTGGFSVCASDPNNKTLALGGSAVFYSCNSGGFNNLYDRSWAPQCSPIYIGIVDQGSASGASGGVSQTSDRQPQAPTSAGVTQISDHQPQAATSAVSAAVTQISDHQPQAGTSAASAAVTQISDHQPQAPTSAPAAPVTQISDHQPQAPTSAPAKATSTSAPAAVVTQISDHQPQAPTSVPAAVVTQISDHQPQAPTSASTPARTPSAVASSRYTGGASAPTGMANLALAGVAIVGAALL